MTQASVEQTELERLFQSVFTKVKKLYAGNRDDEEQEAINFYFLSGEFESDMLGIAKTANDLGFGHININAEALRAAAINR